MDEKLLSKEIRTFLQVLDAFGIRPAGEVTVLRRWIEWLKFRFGDGRRSKR